MELIEQENSELNPIKFAKAKLLDPNADIRYALPARKYGGKGTIVFGRDPSTENTDNLQLPEKYQVKVVDENGNSLKHTETHRREFALTVDPDEFGNQGIFLTNLDKDVMQWGSGEENNELSGGSGMVVHSEKYPAGFWIAMGKSFKVKFDIQTGGSDTPQLITFKPMRVGQI